MCTLGANWRSYCREIRFRDRWSLEGRRPVCVHVSPGERIMLPMTKRLLAAVGLATALATFSTANAALITYDIGWTGNNDWTLSGEFSIDESLLGTGAITAAHLNSMSFSLFLAGAFQAAFALDVNAIPSGYNFNFDTNSEELLVGGLSTGPEGQRWNFLGSTGAGFGSGVAEVASIDGLPVSPDSSIFVSNSTLVATRQVDPAPVPEPGSIALLGLGVIALMLLRARRTRRPGSTRPVAYPG